MTIRRCLIISLTLGLVGATIGAYLVWVHYNLDALVCGTGECEIVQTSEYATLLGIPIAWLGLGMYLTVLALGLMRMRLPDQLEPLSMGALAITCAGTLYSGWLTYLELYVIDAICQWCVASAVVTTLLFLNELGILALLWQEPGDEYDEAAESS